MAQIAKILWVKLRLVNIDLIYIFGLACFQQASKQLMEDDDSSGRPFLPFKNKNRIIMHLFLTQSSNGEKRDLESFESRKT